MAKKSLAVGYSPIYQTRHGTERHDIRACSHKPKRTSFRQILPAAALKIFDVQSVRLQIFALHPAKICSEISTFVLCEQALEAACQQEQAEKEQKRATRRIVRLGVRQCNTFAAVFCKRLLTNEEASARINKDILELF